MHQRPPEHDKPRTLSEHDPPPDADTRSRTPWFLILVVLLLVIAFVALHITGVVGPGSH